jgi:hypothetical protein
MTSCSHLKRQFRAGVPRSDDKDITRRQLAGILIRSRMNLDNRRVEIGGPGWNARRLVGSSCDNDVIRFKIHALSADPVPVTRTVERLDSGIETHRQLFSMCIFFKVVCYLVFGGECIWITWKRKSRKARVSSRREQSKRVPSLPPRVPDPPP